MKQKDPEKFNQNYNVSFLLDRENKNKISILMVILV